MNLLTGWEGSNHWAFHGSLQFICADRLKELYSTRIKTRLIPFFFELWVCDAHVFSRWFSWRWLIVRESIESSLSSDIGRVCRSFLVYLVHCAHDLVSLSCCVSDRRLRFSDLSSISFISVTPSYSLSYCSSSSSDCPTLGIWRWWHKGCTKLPLLSSMTVEGWWWSYWRSIVVDQMLP